jgi:murein tripeptide amidase MpaA
MRLRLLFLVAVLFVLVLTHPARSQDPQRYVVTVAATSPQARTALVAEGWTVWGADTESITLVVTDAGLTALQRQGYRVLAVQPLAFPPNYQGYHDYAEMVAVLQRLAERHPHITRLETIGHSWEGRAIWAMRITDRPHEDEPDEQGILVFAGTHAREHLSVEQALFLLRDLLENYGRDGETTNLVTQRDIWVIPNLNPDGSEYDITRWGIAPPYWRKNRRNNGDGTWGVDLNRNFGYGWGREGSSGVTSAETYRGPAPFSEPENMALRDFVLARPHVRIIVSLHTYGEYVLFPYGYTYEDLPSDMRAEDRAIFVALADAIGDLNGYRPMQASDLYLVSGSHDDWFYGALGIYAMTWELYPRSAVPGFYPPDSVIATQTARNRLALRYTLAMAHDPAMAVGAGADRSPPQVEVVAPEPLFASVPFSVSVLAADDVGVTTVEYLVNGAIAAIATVPDMTASLVLPAGIHELRARGFDAAHHQALSPGLVVTVTEATPTPTLTPTPTPPPTLTPTTTPTPTPTPTPVPVVPLYLPRITG